MHERLSRLVGRAMSVRHPQLRVWQLRRLWRLAKMLDQRRLMQLRK